MPGAFEGVTVLSVSCSGLATFETPRGAGDRRPGNAPLRGDRVAPSCVPRRSELPSLVAPPVRPQRPLPVLAVKQSHWAPFRLESWCAPGANRW